MQKIIILNKKADWPFQTSNIEIVTSLEYLTNPKWTNTRNVQAFNFCKNMGYQSNGYYVSLLAEARKHRVIPSVTTIQDIKTKSVVKVMSNEMTELIQSSLKRIKSDQFILSVYFGRNLSKQYDRLARELYTLFKTPLLQAKFKHSDKWYLQSLSQLTLKDIPEQHLPFVQEISDTYFKKERYFYRKKDKLIFDLAILHNPLEKSPPSNGKALQKFLSVAQDEGFYTEMITKDDYHRLAEFNALFIRETTAVNHHTYRFARRATADGLVVIDDPVSILRCANKVYLAEILNKAKVSSPKTMILQQAKADEIIAQLGLSVVLKQPDSAFSLGVKKAETRDELEQFADEMLNESELIIAQEYMPTVMHPWMNPLMNTHLWPHEYHEIYELYNRIFDCRGHGWSNLQSTHINLPFQGDDEFGRLHAAIRLLLPLIPAISAASPYYESKHHGYKDSRLEAYRHNQEAIPSIAGSIIPKDVYTKADYHTRIFDPIIRDIRPYDTDGILDKHFLNSRGAIARFDRGAIEIRIIDIQESPAMDIAILEMIAEVLKQFVNENLSLFDKQSSIKTDYLANLWLSVIKEGGDIIVDDEGYLRALGLDEPKTITQVWSDWLNKYGENLSDEAAGLFKLIIQHGSLSERMLDIAGYEPSVEEIRKLYSRLCNCLPDNKPFQW